MALHHNPRIVTQGLVLHLDAADKNSYPGTGTAWNDLSGSGNNGTLTNGPTFNNTNGGSIVFDGANDFINTPAQIGTQLTGNFTFTIWAKRNGDSSSAIGGLISNEWHTEFTGVSMFLRNNNTSITIEAGNGTTRPAYVLTPSGFTNMIWNLYTLTYEGTTAKVYLNGQLIDSRTVAVLQNPARGVVLGRWAASFNSYYLNGEISNAGVYNRALSATEILQNYNATKPRFGL